MDQIEKKQVLTEGRIDDLKDKQKEKQEKEADDLSKDHKSTSTATKRKVSGGKYGGGKQKDDEVEESLGHIARALLSEFNLLEAENPYNPNSPEGQLFPQLSPEDQAWLTKGGQAPAFANDPIMKARMPNKGKATVPAPQQAPAPVADIDPATGARSIPDLPNNQAAQATPVAAPAPEQGTAMKPLAAKQTAPAVPPNLKAIMTANTNIKDPNKIGVGQKINLPGGGVYTVAKGDTLSGIASGKFKGQAPGAQPGQSPQPVAGAQPVAGSGIQGAAMKWINSYTTPEQVDKEIARFSGKNDMSLPANQRVLAALQAKKSELSGQPAAAQPAAAPASFEEGVQSLRKLAGL